MKIGLFAASIPGLRGGNSMVLTKAYASNAERLQLLHSMEFPSISYW